VIRNEYVDLTKKHEIEARSVSPLSNNLTHIAKSPTNKDLLIENKYLKSQVTALQQLVEAERRRYQDLVMGGLQTEEAPNPSPHLETF